MFIISFAKKHDVNYVQRVSSCQKGENPIADVSICGYFDSNILKRFENVLLGFIVCRKYRIIDNT